MKLRKHIIPRLIAAGIVAALFIVFGLYYLGYYDVSFITRPESWSDNLEQSRKLFSVFKRRPKRISPEMYYYYMSMLATSAPATDAPETEPAETVPAETEPPVTEAITPPDVPEGEITYTSVFKTVGELEGEGYSFSDSEYVPGESKLGKMEFAYSLPSELYFRYKETELYKETPIEDDGKNQGAPAKGEYVASYDIRPAIELYMGYMIYDDAGQLYLLDSYGTLLCKYDEKTYKKAYTRDTSGRPLFYNTYTYTATAATKTETDEEGNVKVVEERPVSLVGKRYYYLNNNNTFSLSDYDDASQGRGLYFDYPAYYGISDNNTMRVGKKTTVITTCVDRTYKSVSAFEWGYKNIRATVGEDFEYPYWAAYNYSEGYALAGDPETEELIIIDQRGNVTFEAKKNYFSVERPDTIGHDRAVLPDTFGLENIGFFYFDHGYMRLRIQTHENYAITNTNQYSYLFDDDVLIDPRGRLFDMPTNCTLIGYSNGILTLRDNTTGLFGYMDYTGKWIAKCQYKNAAPFIEGVGVLTLQTGEVGAVDTSGNAVLPFRYSYVSNMSSGLCAAFSDSEGWVVYKKMI